MNKLVLVVAMAMNSEKNYFIHPEYRARDEALTREIEPGDYWTSERIRDASFYLTAVYRRASRFLAKRPVGHRHAADVGCGYPVKANKFIKPIADSLIGFDQPTLIKVVKRDFPDFLFRAVDLEHPPKIAERFDLVVCCDVIEHLLNPDPLLEFLATITKTDGVIVLSTVEREVLRGMHCLESPKPEHVREWNMKEFADYISSRSLKVLEHRLCPEHYLNPVENIIATALRPWVRTRRWAGCQLIVSQPLKQ